MTVILYTKNDCPSCVKLKILLQQKGVKFSEHNVDEDKEKEQEMINKSNQSGVPVLDVHGNIIAGYSPYRLRKFLGLEI